MFTETINKSDQTGLKQEKFWKKEFKSNQSTNGYESEEVVVW